MKWNNPEVAPAFAKVKDGCIVRLSTELPSFDGEFVNITTDNAASKGWLSVSIGAEPACDTSKQVAEVDYQFLDGRPCQVWTVRDLSETEIARKSKAFNINVRSQIAALEAQQPRPVRDLLTSDDDAVKAAAKTKLLDIEDRIAALRATLIP